MEKEKEDGDVRDEILQWLQLEWERRSCIHFLTIIINSSSKIKGLWEKDGLSMDCVVSWKRWMRACRS